jgi:hypothetical protein
MLTEIGGAG